MKEITKERAEELDAAWKAATDTQRLTMNRMSWFSSDGSATYWEEEPSTLEKAAGARIKNLEDALRVIADMPIAEQDNMISANMRSIANNALQNRRIP
jgi:hypothetical protein